MVLYANGTNSSSFHSCPEKWCVDTSYLCISAYAATIYEIQSHNYARWGTIYLNEMHEFESGNFDVERASSNFNQVDPDQSQEWLNEIGKKGAWYYKNLHSTKQVGIIMQLSSTYGA